MKLDRLPLLLAGCALAAFAVGAPAQIHIDTQARARPGDAPAAQVAGAPVEMVPAGTVNLRDLASKTTALVRQGIAPAAGVLKRAVPVHRLPSGQTTASANKRAARGVLPLTLNQGVAVQGAGVSANAGVAPPPVGGFVGLSTADNVAGFGSELEPPDQGLAVNNGKVLEATNLMIQLYDGASGNPDIQFDGGIYASPVPLTTFFNDPGAFGDPQVFFDPTLSSPSDLTTAAKGRWIVIVMSQGDLGDATHFYIDVAVSQTSNAAGGWNLYRVRTFSNDVSSIYGNCGGYDCLPDYPKAGFDANGFYISVNLFNASSESFVAAATYALPKGKMRDGLGFNFLRIVYVDPQTNGPSFLVQPSIPAPGQSSSTARGGTEYLLEARKLIDNTNRIRVWAIENTSALVADAPCSPGPGICAINVHFVDVATPTTPGTVSLPTVGYYAGFSFNAQQPNQPGPFSSYYLGYAADIDAGYGGFQSTIQYANGKLFGVLTTANPAWSVGGTPGNLLSWYAITPAVSSTTGAVSATLSAKGTIVPPAGYFLQFPAFALLKSGAGVIGFSIMNPNLNVPGNFPSTGFIRFTGSATSGNLIVTGQGQAADDGFTQWWLNDVGRWGDYGAAVVDPFTAATTPTYYTGNEMIATPYTKLRTPAGNTFNANYSTFISVIH